MAGHASRVGRDIDRWLAGGLIDERLADQLRRDIAAHARGSISFGTIVMMMAALLVCAAILLLVAANWEAIPRPGRVGLLFAVILAGYLGGGVARTRGHMAAGDALWLIAAAAFGGGIALIGQMYHLSGDERTALLTWCGGTALAGLVLGSATLTAAAAAILLAWLGFGGVDFWGRGGDLHLYAPAAAVLWLISLRTGSLAARHALSLGLLFYGCLLAVSGDAATIGAAMAGLGALLFGAAAFLPALAESALRLRGRLDVHALAGFLLGMGFVQADRADDIAVVIFCAAIVFGAIIAAIVLAGRDSRAIRWTAYLGFLAELAFLYINTLGSMLGSVGLFLASGIVLAIVALAVTKVERRLKAGGEIVS
ncbi:MAG: DUF2157 domain-containing protein [Rhizobiaceae bacterium]|nr:DUF2157 domain-containing protein [Rhizobiaceae bacterium]